MLLSIVDAAVVVVILELFLILDNVILFLNVKGKVPKIIFAVVGCFWAVCLVLNLALHIF